MKRLRLTKGAWALRFSLRYHQGMPWKTKEGMVYLGRCLTFSFPGGMLWFLYPENAMPCE